MNEHPEPIQPTCCRRFDFCFWAKLLVAIPAVPIIACSAAMLFDDLLLQSVTLVLTGYATILAAMKIDRLPRLSRRIYRRKN